MKSKKENIYNLPPDLFSRNYFFANGLSKLKEEKKLDRIRVLDVGGRDGMLSEFIDKEDSLTLLDIRPGDEKNLVIGDATDMVMFKDEEFDAVVSGDVFEHIPMQKREKFITESLRVSKYLLILATPFADQSVPVLEKKANDYYRYLHNKDHPWLKEHIDNKLPTRVEVDNILRKFKFPYSVVYSNNIDNWVTIQNFIFYSSKYNVEGNKVNEIFSFYNKNLKIIEDPCIEFYRTIFFVYKDKMDSYKYNYLPDPNIKTEFNDLVIRAISDRTENFLNKTRDQEKNIKALEGRVSELSEKLLSIENSRVWKARNRAVHLRSKILGSAEKQIKNNFLLYTEWIKKDEDWDIKGIKKEIESFSLKPKISIITPVYNVEPRWLNECIQSVFDQIYENWELCIYDDASSNKKTLECLKKWEEKNDQRLKVHYGKKNLHISGASNAAIKLATGNFVTLLDNDDKLSPNALYENVKVLNENNHADFIYSDEDKMAGRDRIYPFFKPDWSPELLQSVNYITHLVMIRKTIGDSVGWFRSGYEGSQDYDLFLRVTSKTRNIVHIPKILYHWRIIEASTAGHPDNKGYCNKNGIKSIKSFVLENKLNARVEPGENPSEYNVHYLHKEPLVSIVIPFMDKVDDLKICLDSIRDKTNYRNYEIILISNKSKEEETERFLNTIKNESKYRLLKYDKPFNFSAINNFAAKKAKGEILLFLNNDTEVISPDWLNDMVGYALRPDVGAVGAKLLFQDGTIQHAGVVLGIKGFADHIYSKLPENQFLLSGKDTWSRNYLAVTGACLMVEKKKFDKVGGFDEEFIVCGSDVEFGLRLYENGLRNVYLSFVKLYHYESKTRKDWVEQVDVEKSVEHYKRFIEHGDPYYNINLSLGDSSGNNLKEI